MDYHFWLYLLLQQKSCSHVRLFANPTSFTNDGYRAKELLEMKSTLEARAEDGELNCP